MIGMRVHGRRKPQLPKENNNKKMYIPRFSPDMDSKDTSVLLKFQSAMDDTIPLFDRQPSPEVPGNKLLQISHMTTEVSLSSKSKPRSSFKDGWSTRI